MQSWQGQGGPRGRGTGGSSSLDDSVGGDWGGVVAEVLSLKEEGIFRTIVGYLWVGE